VIADFTGASLPLPPGSDTGPRFDDDIPQPAWLSPVVSRRLAGIGDAGGHLVVGGRTVFVPSGSTPASVVVSHPNRLGSAEDVASVVDLATKHGATAHVEVDPLLAGIIRLPPLARPIVYWPEAGSASVRAAATRASQAADALRRRLAQIKGITFPVDRPFGRTVTVILPVPAAGVASALGANGTGLTLVDLWEGGLSMTVGWWHDRRQIDSLARAIRALVAGESHLPVPPDRMERIPEDLPHRRLGSIPFS
jgi:hypothetical protein